MTDSIQSRRNFLSSLGALSAVGLGASSAFAASTELIAPTDLASTARGLAAAGDFAFEEGLIYLQTGSLGPTPRPVIQRTIAAWEELQRNPAAYAYGAHEQAMEDVRRQAAALLNCSYEELVLTRSTTEGMNWVAQGLTFAPGDRVLTTDQEHPGGSLCWEYIARRYGVALDKVPIVPGENNTQAIIDAVARRLTPRTRVLSFSHLLSSTGLRMPVAELSALARSRDCLVVVDGAQAVGGIAVDVKALGCHVYATSGHKWLLAPPGTGMLYLSKELGAKLDAISLQLGPAAYTGATGVTGIPAMIGLGAAIGYLERTGIANIETHNLSLRNRLFSALERVPGLKVVSAAPGRAASPLLTFELPAQRESAAFRTLMREKHKFELKVVPKVWLNGIRVSTHLFNSDADVDALAGALRAELA